MWINSHKPILALAPMADMTDSPFCRICREVTRSTCHPEEASRRPKDPLANRLALPNKGIPRYARNDKSDFVIFREMVSSEALVRDSAKTLKMCEFDDVERPIVIQIFGADPKVIRNAARIVVDKFNPDGIDINMGCPVPKIAGRTTPLRVCHSHESGNPGRSMGDMDHRFRGDDSVNNQRFNDVDNKGAGAALMNDPARAVEIVRELKAENLGVPVTVKARLGWSKEDEILEFAPRLEEAGVDAVTIHGRTKLQGYSGKADWEMIGKVRQKLKIPVIANGDIVTSEDIAKCLEITGADGVMIGRGALGNPWILNKSKVDINDIIKVVLRHAELHIERYGERGMVTFRKHLAWYFRGGRIGDAGINMKELRSKLVRVNSLAELRSMLAFFCDESFKC